MTNALTLLFWGMILDSFRSVNASPCVMNACEQCGRLDTMVVFLLTCVLIMLVEGLCFWVVKQISLSFIIPWVMALCLGMRIVRQNVFEKRNFTDQRRGSIPVENSDQHYGMSSV